MMATGIRITAATPISPARMPKNDIFEPLKFIKPDIITIGYDQIFDVQKLEKDLNEHGFHAKVVRIEKSNTCDLCSSGRIIKRVLERNP